MMDDSCAVCAEALEWVAYGPCGHREVCATCVVRLRFVCSDRRCCLCQSHSRAVFVTKALGDFTRLINDFSEFPEDAKEGRVGSFWYHQHTQAYFDDLQQYRKIKSKCKLSCSICDKLDCGANDKPLPKNKKNMNKFQNIGQLRAHITDRHGLYMCSLCLEGRKVFICEQRLYNRAQLEQHIERGDTEVDGDESDRCGFSGHPLCDFCLRNFYGDSELYTHMSRDHYTCHICQRQRPGAYDYYRDYDDLENHFRQVHHLCEESSCLLKKFIVFASEAEMKRHYALEHGENMSRSERKVALQINTCFQHRGRNEGRHSGTRPLVCSADAASMQYVSHLNAHADTASGASRSSASVHPSGSTFVDPEIFSEPSQTSYQIIEESSFPPLPSSSNRRRRKSKNTSTQTATTGTTMASRLRRRYDGSLTVVNAAVLAGPMLHHQSSSSSSSFDSSRSINQLNSGSAPPSECAPSSQRSLSAGLNKLSKSNPSSSSSCGKLTTDRGSSSGSHVSSLQHLGNIIEDDPSSDVTDPVGSGYCSSSRYVAGSGEERNQGWPVQKVQEDAQAANKLLIEKICVELGFDKDKYAAFKLISKEYRKGLIDVREYLAYVQQFGLGNLILDISRLCPDPQKGEELLRAHNYNFGVNNANSKKSSDVVGGEGDMLGSDAKGCSKKGKGKCVEVGRSSSSLESTPREKIISCGKNGNGLEATQKFQKNDKCEVNGSSSSRKGKEKCVDNGTLMSNSRTSTACSLKEKRSSGKLVMVAPSINGGGIKPIGLGGDDGGEEARGSNQGGGSDDGVLIIAERSGEKKGGKEKATRTPKFLRARLGEERSSSSSSEIPNNNIVPYQPPVAPKVKAKVDGRMTSTGGGVWNNGGGRKLVVAMARSKPSRF